MSFGGTGQNRASANSESITEPAVVFEDQMFPGELHPVLTGHRL